MQADQPPGDTQQTRAKGTFSSRSGQPVSMADPFRGPRFNLTPLRIVNVRPSSLPAQCSSLSISAAHGFSPQQSSTACLSVSPTEYYPSLLPLSLSLSFVYLSIVQASHSVPRFHMQSDASHVGGYRGTQ
ncbi:hypothetical protein LIA77_01096 [Sarocladium implicatum]|nr:hypothetical protein LIA77_01096 [Sarocladium implicatum]